ncbi:MAG TPA: TolB-like translocation protein [Chloroflexota bacterium]|nr:TolB-like translocation protein [Chloroflexota bacterium]
MSRTRKSRGSGTAVAPRARGSTSASTKPDRPSRLSVDADAAPPRRADRRLLTLAALSVVCVLVAVGYVALAAGRTDLRAVAAAPTAAPDTLAAVRAQPHVMFLESQGDAFRRVALAPLDGIDGGRVLTNLQCQRVHFAAGRGLCLGRNQLGGAFVFDESFQPGATLPISGIPSRARVSPDGRYGAMTVFVTGHSYSEGGFSTETTLVDMASGKVLGDLERFEILTPDGAKFEAPDFNFWGVTFARDPNRFYATLGTGGRFYLVEGDVAARRLRVVRDGVECPSLSPDGTRIAFKKRAAGGGGPIHWRLAVLDLATMAETPLAETRSVDDQVEWWDNQHLVYFLPDEGPPATIRPDLWVLPADGSGQARRVGTSAFSPAIVVTG